MVNVEVIVESTFNMPPPVVVAMAFAGHDLPLNVQPVPVRRPRVTYPVAVMVTVSPFETLVLAGETVTLANWA